MDEYFLSGFISSICLLIIIIVTVMLFVQSNRMRKDIRGDIDDLVNQINDSQYYAYSFDKLQESNIRNTDHNMNTVLKKFQKHERDITDVTDQLKADVDKMKLDSLTAASIGSKSVPVVKADKLEVNGNIMLPNNGAGVGWAGGSSKIHDNGDLNIVTGKKLNINANLGVNVNTGGKGVELTVNGSGVVLGDYAEFTTVDKSVEKSGGWGIDAANPAWDPDFRGKRVGLAYIGAEHDADANGFYMEFLVPTGMKQAYVVHLPWENCRYFDIMGRIGGDVVFIKRVNAWHPQVRTLDGNKGSWEVGGHHAGATAVGVSGVNRFERIRVQGRVGRIHLMGVGWTKEEGRGMETGYVSWDNVYSKPDLTNPSFNNIYGRGDLFVGMNRNTGTGGTIYIGGTEGDNAHDHTVIEGRNWGGNDKSELLLFKGNDPVNGCNGACGPDRIRLRAAEIDFDAYGGYTTDRNKEDIVAKVTPGKFSVDGALQVKNNIVQGLGESHDDWSGANFKRRDGRWTHLDWVGDGRNYLRGDTIIDNEVRMNANANYIARHLDATTDWARGGEKSLFLGWQGQKVVLGNNAHGKHDATAAAAANTVNVTNPLNAHSDMNVGGTLCVQGTCITGNDLKKVLALR